MVRMILSHSKHSFKESFVLATVLWKEAKKIRKVPIQELIVDLHIENKGFAFSCYKSIFIYDFEEIDTSNSIFYGTMTKI